jgi:hypothetical protein
MKALSKIKWIIILSMVVYFSNDVNSQTNFIYGKQFGSDNDEAAHNPVADHYGNVYIAGETQGVLSGRNFGKTDAFISKFGSTGNMIWTKQFGTSEDDKITDLAIDRSGHLYATGYTKGVLNEKNFGNEDIIVVKFDTAGTIEWQKQYGTDSTDIGNRIYIDVRGNIFVSGLTKGLMGKSSFGDVDCVILKLDNKGNIIWIKQFGTSKHDECRGITGDSESNIYVCGYTEGDLAAKNKGKWDAFIGKFNDRGEQVKIFQFGTNDFDIANCITMDKEKNIYVGGSTGGDFGGKQLGRGDSYLSKLNENFEILWTQQFGTKRWDGVNGIALNEQISENIVVGCCQYGPTCQASIRIFKKDGTPVGVNNYAAIGKNGGTCGQGVCIDNKGNIYQTGNTGGSLFKSIDKTKGHDIFLIKLSMDKSQTNDTLPNLYKLTLKTEDLDKYLGVYSSKQIPLNVTVTKDNVTLIAQATGQSSSPLEAIDKDKFQIDDGMIILEFNTAQNELTVSQANGEIFLLTKGK